jgi:hypothetical protein
MHPAILAHVLLAATRIVSILDDVLALASSAFVRDRFCYHILTIPLITSKLSPSNLKIARKAPASMKGAARKGGDG